MNIPLRMPAWSDADPALRKRYEGFVAKAPGMNASTDIGQLNEDGLQLANDLKREAQRLGFSKAYEFSGDIYWLDQAAATVAFLLGGSQSSLFRQYLEGVLYYQGQVSTRDRVERFLVYTGCGS